MQRNLSQSSNTTIPGAFACKILTHTTDTESLHILQQIQSNPREKVFNLRAMQLHESLRAVPGFIILRRKPLFFLNKATGEDGTLETLLASDPQRASLGNLLQLPTEAAPQKVEEPVIIPQQLDSSMLQSKSHPKQPQNPT